MKALVAEGGANALDRLARLQVAELPSADRPRAAEAGTEPVVLRHLVLHEEAPGYHSYSAASIEGADCGGYPLAVEATHRTKAGPNLQVSGPSRLQTEALDFEYLPKPKVPRAAAT